MLRFFKKDFCAVVEVMNDNGKCGYNKFSPNDSHNKFYL